MVTRHRGYRIGLGLAVGLGLIAASACAQQVPTVSRGVAYLKSHATGQRTGQAALAALAMIKAEVPADDPGLKACLEAIDRRFEGSTYRPDLTDGPDMYECGIVIMVLANLDPGGRTSQIKTIADYIVSKQKPSGGWDYGYRSFGDTSISQYAILGLWEAENVGIVIHPRVWDEAAKFFLATQGGDGGWMYHRDEGNMPETLSMTAAGVGSLLICQKQLQAHRQEVSARNPYLVPLLNETQRVKYRIQTPQAKMTQGANAGIAWISKNFTTTNTSVIGQSMFYCLYGLERVGALAGRKSFGNVDWFDQGSRFIVSKQESDGSFINGLGQVPNTAWAVLFLTKSTAKSLERIRVRRLGAGVLYGGKGLPKDLSSISEAGGRLIARPMDGAIEGMLTVLEDPRAESADSALAGLIDRFRKDGPKAILPYRDRFLKLRSDRDQGLRRVAAWALARMGDLSLTPALIDLLNDPDQGVVDESRQGLQLLSRKIDGFGPPSPSTVEQRLEAAKAWRAWYERVRPLRVDDGDGPVGTGNGNPKPIAGAASP